MPEAESSTFSAQVHADLASQLSNQDLLSSEAPPRWSSFEAPRPGVVVNVETEQDVAAAVKYCAEKNIPFLAQNGGNGWSSFSLASNGVLINLAKLNSVTFNADKTRATIGGGAIIKDTIDKAHEAGALLVTGNCNCVGTLGAMLGGGYGNLQGLYGFGVDNIVALNVVTADGTLQNVTASSNPDLFWALRGAGPNLGIVTSAEVKSYPASADDLLAWAGAVIFTPDKLEQLFEAVQKLHLTPEMVIFVYFAGSPQDNSPVIVVTPFLHKGTVESGHAAFASIYDVGPVADMTGVFPYNQWNAGGDPFCSKGPRRPAYSAGFETLKPDVYRKIWDKFVEFQSKPTAERSVIILECYSHDNDEKYAATDSAFPHRKVNVHGIVVPWYEDASLDADAEKLGREVRQLWHDSNDSQKDAVYVNFARGDEDLSVIYGSNLERLQSIKKKVDPNNRFNHWFNIK